MREVTVWKNELLQILRTNRENHRAIFEEALEGYKQRVIEELEARLNAARTTGVYDARIVLVQPEDHTKEYDRAIQMLEMHTEETVIVEQMEFANFVQDEWGWTDRFLTSNAPYSKRAETATADRNKNKF